MDLPRSLPRVCRSLVLGSLLVILPSLLRAQAQATTGVVRGTVTDSTGQPIVGATVTLRNLETNADRSLTTNQRGVYVATLLRVGTYDVSSRAVGFRQSTRSKVPVGLGESVELNFALAPQVVQLQELNVAAEPALDIPPSTSATRLGVEAVEGLPNNGRNIFNYTTLTPNVATVQGPDGDEISIGGQRGIHNNVSVDGADFNNPFFGEQRGGQRPAFTFNLDAVQDFVVVSDGANAEFGRSGGGFLNIITKSGTNEFHGSGHYFGKYDALSADFSHSFPGGTTTGFTPDFAQHQFGATFGGPIVRDRAFFFLAYDQQEYNDTKQTTRLPLIDPALLSFVDTAFGGALQGDFGPISRTNDANAFLAKLDFRLGQKHNATLKYNYTNSRQVNGTFDVDFWGRSANALERDFSHAVNGGLTSLFSSSLSNEFRFQWAREDRPRPYEGPTNPSPAAGGRPFPDTDVGFFLPGSGFNGYRIGMPFFIPVDAYDYRFQVLDNVSLVRGSHLFKFGAEWNRTGVNQTFRGFGNGRIGFTSVGGFLNYVANGNQYVECSDDVTNTFVIGSNTGCCPVGTHISGPVVLYLQQAGIGGLSVDEAGTQTIIQHELAVFLQDSWKPRSNLDAQLWPSVGGADRAESHHPDPGSVLRSIYRTNGYQRRRHVRISGRRDDPQRLLDVPTPPGRRLRRQGRRQAGGPGQRGALLRPHPRPQPGQQPEHRWLARPIDIPQWARRTIRAAARLRRAAPDPLRSRFTVPARRVRIRQGFPESAHVHRDRRVRTGALPEPGGIAQLHPRARTDHLTRFFNANDAVFGDVWSTGITGAGRRQRHRHPDRRAEHRQVPL